MGWYLTLVCLVVAISCVNSQVIPPTNPSIHNRFKKEKEKERKKKDKKEYNCNSMTKKIDIYYSGRREIASNGNVVFDWPGIYRRKKINY